jgi:RpiB/LacA/LacB family sugar-phosphate isomerase
LREEDMRIAVGSDHAGFHLKEELKSFIGNEHQVIDVGTHSTDPADYPDFAEALALEIVEKRADRGILICGSGVGASIASNKIPGIRAGICHDTYSAHQSVEHDDVNVLVLGARIIGIEVAREIVASFLSAKYTAEERHERRLGKLLDIEKRYGKST